MNVKPLTGRVMVRILPDPKQSATGLVAFPDKMPLSAERVQEGHRNPQKPPGIMCRVEAIGPLRLRKGRYQMPPVAIGAKVVIENGAGEKLRRFGEGFEHLRMLDWDRVLAVLE